MANISMRSQLSSKTTIGYILYVFIDIWDKMDESKLDTNEFWSVVIKNGIIAVLLMFAIKNDITQRVYEILKGKGSPEDKLRKIELEIINAVAIWDIIFEQSGGDSKKRDSEEEI